MDAAIYHFTDKSNNRPSVYQKQVEILKRFAKENGWDATGVYVDFSLLKRDRKEFEHLMSEAEKYKILVVKDFYHLSKNTTRCMDILKELRDKGIEVHSIENGFFQYEDIPLDKPLRVATYQSHYGYRKGGSIKADVQEEIFSSFIKKKTKWIYSGKYVDEMRIQNDSEQKELMQLIQDHDQYDIILVRGLNDIHWRTSKFCSRREELKLDIYSLQDGFLRYGKEQYGRKCST